MFYYLYFYRLSETDDPSMVANFMCQLGSARVPGEWFKHPSRGCWEGYFLHGFNTGTHRYEIKQMTLPNMGGPHAVHFLRKQKRKSKTMAPQRTGNSARRLKKAMINSSLVSSLPCGFWTCQAKQFCEPILYRHPD